MPFFLRPKLMPLGLFDLIIILISEVLLIVSDAGGNLIQLEILDFPCVDDPEQLVERGPEVGVGSEQVAD